MKGGKIFGSAISRIACLHRKREKITEAKIGRIKISNPKLNKYRTTTSQQCKPNLLLSFFHTISPKHAKRKLIFYMVSRGIDNIRPVSKHGLENRVKINMIFNSVSLKPSAVTLFTNQPVHSLNGAPIRMRGSKENRSMKRYQTKKKEQFNLLIVRGSYRKYCHGRILTWMMSQWFCNRRL